MAADDKGYLRIGKISKIDYPKGIANITYEDLNDSTTAMFSFLAWQYWMPKVGDQVLVAHFSNGTCAAVILGPVWHDGHRPPEGYEGLYRKDFNREYWKAYERYDHNPKIYSLHIGSVVVTIKASGEVIVDADTVTINADTIINGSLTQGGAGMSTDITGNLTVQGGTINLN